MLKDKAIEQTLKFGTPCDKRSENSKVKRLLHALAIELKDLPYGKQLAIDYIINDIRDGYKFNWLGVVDFNRCFIEG